MVLGHESSGIVFAAGSEAAKTHKKGDPVAMEPQIPCRRCARCRSGHYNLCPDIKFAATPPVDGTLARYYKLPVDFCHKLPDGMKLEHGALCEPASVAVHACREANVGAGSKVVVFGAGPVGLLSCGVAKAMGAGTVVVVDVNNERLDFAKKYADVQTFKTEKGESVEDSAERLKKECGLGDGADAVLEATGAEPCIRIGCNVLRGRGIFCQIGMVSSSWDYYLE
jgi:D-xylulose reductase